MYYVAKGGTMETMTATNSGPMTVQDLEGMPDDGRRYELIDGVLIVTPAPGTRHQKIALRLGWLLDIACPDEYEVLTAPYAVHVGVNVELQPDVLVGRLTDFTEKDLPHPPVLVVEVSSPSTTLIDRNVKKAAYERMGVPSYWIIDPAGPRLTVFELDDTGGYVETATVTGTQVYEARQPFPVRIVSADLLGRFRPE